MRAKCYVQSKSERFSDHKTICFANPYGPGGSKDLVNDHDETDRNMNFFSRLTFMNSRLKIIFI